AVGLLYGLVVAPWRRQQSWYGELGLFLAAGWLILFCSLAPGLHKAHYLIQGLPAECLLIGMAATAGWRYVLPAHRTLRPVPAVGSFVALALPLIPALYGLALGWSGLSTYTASDAYLTLHRSAGTLTPLVRYIQEHSAPDDLIYVHSEAPELYFLAQ